MMRFPEVYAVEMMCIRPHGLATDLELVIECKKTGIPGN
jgi:hypothetical protein